MEFYNEFGEGVHTFVENLDTSLNQYVTPSSFLTLLREKRRRAGKKKDKNTAKEWEQTRVIPSWIETSSKLPVKQLDGRVVEGK